MRAVDPDLPRAVRRGPPITLTCECGEKREVRYGESWQCEGCGRSFDTRRIPLEEYAAIHRARVRDRLLPAAVLLLVAGVALAFVLSGRWPAAVLIVPLSGFVWSTFVRPARRRRQYREIAELPRWEINSD
jgi:Flp pilus assembly protein TadB